MKLKLGYWRHVAEASALMSKSPAMKSCLDAQRERKRLESTEVGVAGGGWVGGSGEANVRGANREVSLIFAIIIAKISSLHRTRGR